MENVNPAKMEFSTLGDGSNRMRFQFSNGYGISIVSGPGAYADDEHPYEAAVLYEGELCYDTPITADVLGYRTKEQVDELALQISELPRRIK